MQLDLSKVSQQLLAIYAQKNFLEEQDLYEQSLSEFFKGSWPYIENAPFLDNWAIDAMAEHLEAVTYGQIKRLLINISPRCGKTNLTSIAWPAWTWAQKNRSYLSGPQVKFMCGSYNDKLTLTNSNKIRRLIGSPFYQKYWADRFDLREDQNTKSHFDNTAGGGLIATSVRGTLLGVGGDILCVDDPHNTSEAASESERETAENWWKELSSTRLNNPQLTPIVVNMQRLHTKDISGLILDGEEDYVHLMIPMRYDERRKCVTVVLPRDQVDELGNDLPEELQIEWTDPRETPGELMWPERFDEKAVRRMEARLGPIMASGRLQQQPIPAGGAIIKRDYWQSWDDVEAAKYNLEWNDEPGHRKEFPDFELIIASLDTAFGDKEENDFSAMTVWGVFVDHNRNPRVMLVYGWAKKLPLHGDEVEQKSGEAGLNFRERRKKSWGLVELVADTCKTYHVTRLLVENKARGYDVAKEINRLYARENWGVELVNPVKDKVTRAHSVVPVFSNKIVYAPTGLAWAGGRSSDGKESHDGVITECEYFPKGEHDDYVDTVTQAIMWLRNNGILIRSEEYEAQLEDEATYASPKASVAEIYGV